MACKGLGLGVEERTLLVALEEVKRLGLALCDRNIKRFGMGFEKNKDRS